MFKRHKPLTLILILSILVSLMGGCSRDSDDVFLTKLKSDSKLEIYLPETSLSIPQAERTDKWEKYMRNKYGYILDLQYVSRPTNGYPDYEKLLDLSGGEGLIAINSFSFLSDLISNDMIMPLNFYLDEINDYDINPGMIDSLIDSSGTLWALPLTKGKPMADKRTYNKEWLDKSEASLPENIDEFYDYAMYVAYGDPDGNGVNDTYIAEYTAGTLFFDFSDVFKAFGCYQSHGSAVGYNPLNMNFENFITDGNFIEAMTYIKALDDQGLIINSETAKHEYQVASSMDIWTPGSDVEKAYGYYLTGPNEKRLIEERYPELCIAVLKQTDKPSDKLDAFYNIIYSALESSMDFAFGIKDEDYFDMIDYYRVRVVSGDVQEQRTHDIGLYTDLNRPPLDVKPIVRSNDPIAKTAVEEQMAALVDSRAADEGAYRYLGTDLSYRIGFDVYDVTTETPGYIQKDWLMMINDILIEDVPIEEAVTEYRKSVEN